MNSASARKPRKPRTHGSDRIDRETTEAAGREPHALLALARLLGRQAAREFIHQQRSNNSLIEPPVEDAR
jgi:hypothetical protein